MSKDNSATTAAKGGEKKIGLERFLQLEPQKSGISAILRRRYASQVMTQTDWEQTVENILNRKVK